MNGETGIVLGVAVTIAVAAIACLWKIVEQIRANSAEQSTARHLLRDELIEEIRDAEMRNRQRIERLEETSYGWQRQHRRGDFGGFDDGQ